MRGSIERLLPRRGHGGRRFFARLQTQERTGRQIEPIQRSGTQLDHMPGAERRPSHAPGSDVRVEAQNAQLSVEKDGIDREAQTERMDAPTRAQHQGGIRRQFARLA